MAPAAATNKQQGGGGDGELRILCIDGGGIRGLIPAKILEYLESELQRIEGSSTARVADYFDYIAGTSTGALVTTMLTAPNYRDNNRPLYTAKDIIQLYLTEGPGIFRNDHRATWIQVVFEAVLVYIRDYQGSNETLKFLRDVLALAPQPSIDAILNALLADDGRAAAAAAATNGGALQLADLARSTNGGDAGAEAESAGAGGIQEQAGAILQALCHVQGRAVEQDDASFRGGVREVAEGLRAALRLDDPDTVRYLLLRPKYDGEGLERVLKDKLGNRYLNETATNVIVPTFDVKRNQPVVFSTSQARKDQLMNPFLRDICTAATAAPTYFPAHSFTTYGWLPPHRQDFNLVDAGVFANNPTTVAMNEIWRTMDRGEELPVEVPPLDCTKLRVLSIGTGVVNHSYTADECNWWGLVRWMLLGPNGTQPLMDTLTYASGSLVDYNVALLFSAQGCQDNYLRIQEDNLEPALGAMDDTSKMKELIEVGEKLLKRQVYRTDCETRKYQPVEGGGTNEAALTKLAEQLVAEKNRRKEAAAAAAPHTEVITAVVDVEPRLKRFKPAYYVLQ